MVSIPTYPFHHDITVHHLAHVTCPLIPLISLAATYCILSGEKTRHLTNTFCVLQGAYFATANNSAIHSKQEYGVSSKIRQSNVKDVPALLGSYVNHTNMSVIETANQNPQSNILVIRGVMCSSMAVMAVIIGVVVHKLRKPNRQIRYDIII